MDKFRYALKLVLTFGAFALQSVIAEPVKILVDMRSALQGVEFNNHNGAAVSDFVQVSHPAFDFAQRYTVNRAVTQPHLIQLRGTNADAIPAKSTLLLRLTLRSAATDGSKFEGQLYVQDSKQGYRSLGHRAVTAGENWTEIDLLIPTEKSHAEHTLGFSLFMGRREQAVDVGNFRVYLLTAEPDTDLLRSLQAAHTISVDFEEPFATITPPEDTKSTITGELPVRWEEDSAWANVDIEYATVRQNPFEGEQSLGVSVKAIRGGSAQFRIPNLNLSPLYQLQIRMATRSPTSTSFRVDLRQRDAPYTSYWSSNVPAAPEWGVVEMLAPVNVVDPKATLLFSLDQPGTIEIDALSIRYVTPEQAFRGRNFEGNLLAKSIFPLGLTAPWAAGGNGKPAGSYSADAYAAAPSGKPALKVVPFMSGGRPEGRITIPFEGRPGAAHTFSVWMHSSVPGQSISMRMGPPREELYRTPWERSVQLTGSWKRYSFTTTLPPSPDGFYLARLNTHQNGAFWVDQAMVEVGESPSDFAASMPVEIHAVAGRDYGLSFESETLDYSVAVVGDLSAIDHIQKKVSDLYGNQLIIPGLHPNISPEEAVSGRYLSWEGALPALELPPLGSFVVELTAFDAGGQALSKPTELILHRIREPHHWGKTAPESAFGTHVFSTDHEARMAKALGFNWVRTNYKLNWSGLERSPGVWTWDTLDAILDTFTRNDLVILAYLGGVPDRASYGESDWPSGWWRMTSAPRHDQMDAWQAYAFRIFERYGERLHAVENWNEPFLPGFFPWKIEQGRPVRAPASLFYEMSRRVRLAADEAGYDGPVLWNTGAHYGASQRTFDAENVALGTPDQVDGFTLHRYTNQALGAPGDQFDQDVAVLRETLGDAAEGHVFWNSEGGFGLSEVFNLYRHIPPYDMHAQADRQANNMVRYFLSNFAAGIEKVFIYSFFETDEWRSNYSYLNIDGRLSQTAPAVSNLTWQLEGTRFVQRKSAGKLGQLLKFACKESDARVFTLIPNPRAQLNLRHIPDSVEIYDLYGNTPRLPFKVGNNVLYLRSESMDFEAMTALLKNQ